MAVGQWGMRPKDFWRLTAREWWWLHDARKAGRMYGSLTEAEVKELYDSTYGES